MTNEEKLQRLFEILDEVSSYERCIGKVYFDMECIAPPEGIEKAGEDMAILGKHVFELTHSDEFVALIKELKENSDGLSDLQKSVVKKLYEDWEKTKNVSKELNYEASVISGTAYSKWLEAKKQSNFSLFRDSLDSMIKVTRKLIDTRENKAGSYYDCCLDDYEKGGNTTQLDAFFAALKERTVPLVKRIKENGKEIRLDFMSRRCPIPKQEEMSKWLLEKEGLRPTALVLMTTEHPFTTNFGPWDVRVTTHYYEDNFISNVFSTLHEGGHALFMQNEPDAFYENHADNGMSNAMHECISRFYENIIGRSEAFISCVFPKLREISGDTLSDVTERELYEAVNAASPGLIRMEADELTYSLHIMIRYELEKAFMNGDITVDEIPTVWNEKYKEYLGVDVPSDAFGCLQDVHWTDSFGYFPSYALGNAYGAQILNTMKKEFDVFGAVRNGELDKILSWLRERVFSIASVSTPDEWIRAITGESLNVNYFLDYLEEKYTSIYGL